MFSAGLEWLFECILCIVAEEREGRAGECFGTRTRSTGQQTLEKDGETGSRKEVTQGFNNFF